MACMRDKPEWVSRPDLGQIVADSTTLSQVLTQLGLVPAGGNYAVMRKWLRHLNIPTDHFTQKGKRRIGHGTGERVMCKNSHATTECAKRQLLCTGVPYMCVSCGIRSWMDHPITLELDHIDGDRRNHSPDNLRLLCPNCHSQTPNFRGRNCRNSRQRVSKTGFVTCACGKPISSKANLCSDCYRSKTSWPADPEFIEMVKAANFSAVARKLGVSNTSVSKRYRRLVGP